MKIEPAKCSTFYAFDAVCTKFLKVVAHQEIDNSHAHGSSPGGEGGEDDEILIGDTYM